MNDSEIVKLFWDRNEAALSETQKAYGNYCRCISQNMLLNEQDSEECVNDVLLAAWKSIPPQEPENLKTYLGRLTRVISVDRIKKRNAQKRIPAEMIIPLDELEEAFGACEVESAVEEEELSKRISEYLRCCRKDERNIFIRRYWYYDSVDSICSRYGFGRSKVLVTLKRTRDKLAKYLEKEGYTL